MRTCARLFFIFFIFYRVEYYRNRQYVNRQAKMQKYKNFSTLENFNYFLSILELLPHPSYTPPPALQCHWNEAHTEC